MTHDTERRLQALERHEAPLEGEIVIVWEQHGLSYTMPPYRPEAVLLTADELAAIRERAKLVITISYVDDWRGVHETES